MRIDISDGALRRFKGAKVEVEAVVGLAPDHPAVVAGRTVFPKSVVESIDSPRILVSGHNNPKLGSKVTRGPRVGWPIYHVTLEERATCPRSCAMWAGCYGSGMPYARRHAPDDKLIPYLREEIAETAARHPGGFMVRLHTLGDFYSVAYVEAWADMLAQHPALHVFGFSARDPDKDDEDSRAIARAVRTLTEVMWDRFAVRFSRSQPEGQAAVVFLGDPSRPDVVMCPAQVEKTAACATCGLCWAEGARDKTIGFLRHGMKRNPRKSLAAVLSPEERASILGGGKVMAEKRAVVGINMHGIAPAGVSPDETPEFRWVEPERLLVDETYQRTPTERSVTLIRKIVATWDWRRFKPPIVAETADGFEVIDGQHTAIAAASHPGVKQIPVMVVSAPEQEKRAAAFLGHNRDRLGITPMQIHAAAVAAGDEDALTVAQVCQRAGVNILKTQPGNGAYRPGDTLAIAAIRSLISRRGVVRARQVLEVLTAARCAPVAQGQIRAVDMLMHDDEYSGQIVPADLTSALIASADELEQEAKVFAATHNLPIWKALGITLFKRCRRGRRRAA